MCAICGCSGTSPAKLGGVGAESAGPQDSHRHHDHHDHESRHPHRHAPVGAEHHHHRSTPARRAGTIVTLERAVLEKNDRIAEGNRLWLKQRRILALNLVSSPGAGKTSLLERTIRDIGSELAINVVEGDQETMLDAERIHATGCRAIQINTGAGCHLEAEMVGAAMRRLTPPVGSVLMIENVGNLVCPALFDLGEHAKVAILSVTEGEDKPLKYPHMFQASAVLLLNKIDLLPYLNFDLERCLLTARTVNPDLQIFLISALSGQGLADWYGWIRDHIQRA